MRGSVNPGISVAKTPGHTEPIEWAPTAITAFTGRARRGPVNKPVTVRGFAEFERIFGGLWGPSPLAYAVKDFFEYGGETAVIVRVVRGGRATTIDLPAGKETLRLRALYPGASEALRIAVDFDHITPSDTDLFNLTVQRVAAPGSALIEDQEIFDRVSTLANSGSFVKDRMMESHLVRVDGRVPLVRPNRTGNPMYGLPGSYVTSNADGDDGESITDEDLIGTGKSCTGIFALKNTQTFNLLCLPPLTRTRDVGNTAWRFAARFCEQRGAMLLVDAAAAWSSVEDVRNGIERLGLKSANAALYFPRLRQTDPLLGEPASFAPCGVVAGIIARTDRKFGPWRAPAGDFARVRSHQRMACEFEPRDYACLADERVNCIRWFGAGKKSIASAYTLADPAGPVPEWRYLPGRRLALFLRDSIRRGTEWAVFEPNTPGLWSRLRLQVGAFMHRCYMAGMFSGEIASEACFVKCDGETTTPADVAAGVVNVHVAFAPTSPGDFVELKISQNVSNETGKRQTEQKTA